MFLFSAKRLSVVNHHSIATEGLKTFHLAKLKRIKLKRFHKLLQMQISHAVSLLHNASKNLFTKT